MAAEDANVGRGVLGQARCVRLGLGGQPDGAGQHRPPQPLGRLSEVSSLGLGTVNVLRWFFSVLGLWKHQYLMDQGRFAASLCHGFSCLCGKNATVPEFATSASP